MDQTMQSTKSRLTRRTLPAFKIKQARAGGIEWLFRGTHLKSKVRSAHEWIVALLFLTVHHVSKWNCKRLAWPCMVAKNLYDSHPNFQESLVRKKPCKIKCDNSCKFSSMTLLAKVYSRRKKSLPGQAIKEVDFSHLEALGDQVFSSKT